MVEQAILVIEDDKKLNDGICLALKKENRTFFQCRTLKEAREIQKTQEISLFLLDVNLPDGDGLDYLKEIRETRKTPVVLITVNGMEVDVVTGLELGANDYITKPFSLMVLRARVEVQLRNEAILKEEQLSKELFFSGKFRFDFKKMEFMKEKQGLELSKTEQRLLRCLIESKGKTLSRNYLIDCIWQGDTEYVEEHALTVAVNRLRSKLGEDQEYIKTVYGIGYTWVGI